MRLGGGSARGQSEIFYTTGVFGKRALPNRDLRRKTTLFDQASVELGLILYLRDPTSAFPTRIQRQSYDSWFEKVAVVYDIPGGKLGVISTKATSP